MHPQDSFIKFILKLKYLLHLTESFNWPNFVFESHCTQNYQFLCTTDAEIRVASASHSESEKVHPESGTPPSVVFFPTNQNSECMDGQVGNKNP